MRSRVQTHGLHLKLSIVGTALRSRDGRSQQLAGWPVYPNRQALGIMKDTVSKTKWGIDQGKHLVSTSGLHMYTHTHTHTHTHTIIHMHTHAHAAHTLVHMHVHTHTIIHMHTHAHAAHTLIYMHVHTYNHTHAHTYTCTYIKEGQGQVATHRRIRPFHSQRKITGSLLPSEVQEFYNK
jgi:hypothetical protein